jgi:hypothetical protein
MSKESYKVKNAEIRSFLLLLVCFTANLPIPFIGVIRLGEIFCLAYIVIRFGKVINLIRKNSLIKIVSLFFGYWCLFGLLSTIINANGLEALLKGVANVFTIYSCIIALFLVVGTNLKTLSSMLIMYGLGSLFFSPYSYGGLKSIESFWAFNITVDNYFDIYMAPLITPILLGLTIKFNHKLISFLTFVYGLLSFYFDSKANGLIFFLASISFWLNYIGFKLTISKFLFIIFGIVCSAPFVLGVFRSFTFNAGEINPILTNNLLFSFFLSVDRPEPIVGLLSVIDSPIIGHGFNKMDSQYAYLAQNLGFISDSFDIEKFPGIYAHSVIVITMIETGLTGIFLWLWFFKTTVSTFIETWNNHISEFKLTFFIIFYMILWNILFSGISRFDLAYQFTIVFFIRRSFFKFNRG